MRILHVIAGIAPEHGGPTAVLREMSAQQARRGHAVTVLTTDSAGGGRRLDAAARDFEAGVEVLALPALVRRSPHLSPAHVLAAASALGRFDLAHVHGLFAAPPSLAMAAFRARGLPYLLRPCGMLDAYSLSQRARAKRLWLALFDRPNLLGAARVQASSEHEAAAVRALMPAALHGRVVVLPQGVAPPLAPTGRRLHARRYLLFLSRLARKKGLLLLLDAFADLAPALPELDLVLVGPDEAGHRAEVEGRARALGLAARVVFAGAVAGADKSDWLAGAEALALPSDDENFGVVVIEAAQLGTPLVVSDRVGLAPEVELLGAGVVAPRQRAALAQALQVVLARRRAPFADGLLALAAAYDSERLAERLEVLYRAILAMPAAPA